MLSHVERTLLTESRAYAVRYCRHVDKHASYAVSLFAVQRMTQQSEQLRGDLNCLAAVSWPEAAAAAAAHAAAKVSACASR